MIFIRKKLTQIHLTQVFRAEEQKREDFNIFITGRQGKGDELTRAPQIIAFLHHMDHVTDLQRHLVIMTGNKAMYTTVGGLQVI